MDQDEPLIHPLDVEDAEMTDALGDHLEHEDHGPLGVWRMYISAKTGRMIYAPIYGERWLTH